MRVSRFVGVLAVSACLGASGMAVRGVAEDAVPKVEAAPKAEAAAKVETITIDATKEPGSAEMTIKARVVVAAGGGTHWLGILTVPADDSLKSQLKLDDRMIVQQVIPDSPAAKAGIKQYDILLKIGEAEIHNIQDLMQTVEKNPDVEMKLLVLRAGKEESINIKSEKRPENLGAVYSTPELQKLQEQLQEKVNVWVQGKGGVWRPDQGLQMRFVGPGFVGEGGKLGGKFPDDLSVSVTKEGDKPAKIVVQKKDQKWEIKQDELDKLPADVRPFVERMLGFGTSFHSVTQSPTIRSTMQGVEGVTIHSQPVPVPVPATNPEQVRKTIEMHRDMHGVDAVGELRKQLDELRKEVEQLKAKPADAAPEKKP
jgi:membrane-associated protease RseP (regulator of RpoE activity)